MNLTDGSTVTQLNLTVSSIVKSSVATGIGQLTYNFTSTATANESKVYLMTPEATPANILDPALIIWEEKDDNTAYEVIVVTLEQGNTGDDGVGVNDVIRSWGNDAIWDSITLASDSKKTREADLYGVIAEVDSSDSDQKSATISYPDEQIYAQIYVAEESAAITPGSSSSGSGGQILIVKDSNVDSVSGKNLVVVGGSCINTVAAKILGSDTPMCTSAFTDATGVGAGQYIIKTVASPYAAADSGKIAMLVAGYNAADTVNAVNKALEGVDSTVDTEQVYPITSTA